MQLRPRHIVVPVFLAIVVIALSSLVRTCMSWWSDAEPEVQDAAVPLEKTPPRKTMAPTWAPQRISLAISSGDGDAAFGLFSGKVLSSDGGLPVVQAELSFVHEGKSESVFSDERGNFEFRPPEPGNYEVADIAAQGYLPFSPEWGASPLRFVARERERISGLTLYLQPAINYSGLVLSPEGVPVEKARVRVSGVLGDLFRPSDETEMMISDAQGKFSFAAYQDAIVEVSHSDFGPGRAVVDFGVRISRRLVIRLTHSSSAPKTDWRISGRVLDSEGNGVPEVRVTVEGRSTTLAGELIHRTARTGDEGQFVLSGLERGWYAVNARSGALVAHMDRVRAGSKDVELTLQTGCRLVGHVSAGHSNKPVPSFMVVVTRRLGLENRDAMPQVIFDAKGFYEIKSLATGSYSVAVTANGYAAALRDNLRLSNSECVQTVDFVLVSGRSLTGTVVDARSRQPLSGARVVVEGDLSTGTSVPVITDVITDEKGVFQLRGLGENTFSIMTQAAQHHGRIISGLKAEGQKLVVDLTPADGEEPKLELTGVGISVTTNEDNLVIGHVMPGGGAAQAGLKAGDQLLGVDGQPVAMLGLQGAVEHIRGPEGSSVVLTVRRADGGENEDVVVYRRRVRG